MFKSSPLASTSKSSPDDDEPLHMPFSTAHLLVEASVNGKLTPQVSTFLKDHLQQLKNPSNPFPRADKAKQELASGQLQLVGGGKAKVDKSEQDAVLDVASRFNLDEQESLIVLRTVRDGKQVEKLNEDDWRTLTAHVFEERMAVIAIVQWLVHTHEEGNSDHPGFELASELVPSILGDDFTRALLDSFVARTQAPLPDVIRPSQADSSFWTKQLIREQKALLELVFLVFYLPSPADGVQLAHVLEIIAKTEWGQRQETFGYFDSETQALVREIGDLLTIIAIAAFNLESAMEQDYPIPPPGEQGVDAQSVYHPANLRKINERVEALVRLDGEKSSPILLSWAFLLSRVTNSLVDRGVPEAYHDFASQALHVESSSSASRSTSQPLFQLYAAHALSPSASLFPTILSITSSPLLGSPHLASLSSEPNATGYLSVLRGLVTCLPLLIRLSFLSAEQFDSLLEAFAAIFGNSSSALLCEQFWREHAGDDDGMGETRSEQSTAELEIVSLAQSRFPVQLGGLVGVMRALCAGASGVLSSNITDDTVKDEDRELLAKRCALSAFRYLAHLPSFTHIVPSAPSVTPLPYEVAVYPDVTYRATRPIPVSPNFSIPVGTTGRLLSQEGRKPVVVAWDLEWSGWRLFGDVLDDFADLRKGATSADVFGGDSTKASLPIEWESAEQQVRDVVAILDIFRLTITNDAAMGRVLVEHLDETINTKAGGSRHDFVEVLFRILERALLVPRSIPTQLVSSLLDLIASLLPTYPGSCWTFLRGSTSLFPSSSTSTTKGYNQGTSRSAILQAEKLAGRYPITLSLLSLARALTLEDQVTSRSVNAEFREVKHGVLVRVLSWIRDEVWPSFSSWRFVDLAEKYEMASRMVQLYRLVLEEGELSPTVAKGEFNPTATIIIEALLSRATVGQLVPLLANVAAGAEPIITLRKATRFVDAQASENLVESSLELVRKLLRIRRRIAGTTSSLLEKLSLSPTLPEGLGQSTLGGGSSNRGELLGTLARYIILPLSSPRVAIQAAKVITLLCLGSSDWQPRPPSLIALLGGSEKVEAFVTSILEIASDPLADEQLQVALWDMISAIVETQPGLAILLVTGRHYPFGADPSKDDKGKGKEVVSASEESARALAKTLTPPPFKPLRRTAIGVGLETIGIWSEVWESHPALLAAVLRFFDFAFQHLVDYGTALDDFRGRAAAWEQFVKIAFNSPGEQEPEDDEGTRTYCHRVMAKAHAVRILALDIQLAMTRPKPEEAVSTKALLKALSGQSQLSSALHTAVETSCAPNLHAGIFDLVHESFPGVDVDALRLPPQSHPLDDSREYGSGYLYSLPILRRQLDGYLGDSSTMVGADDLGDVIHRVSLLNLNFSLVDAQVSNTRSWRQLLEIALPLIRRDPGSSATLLEVAPDLVAKQVADDSRDGKIILAVQDERLSILLTLVEVLQGLSSTKAKDKVVKLLHETSRIFASQTLQPLESVARRTTPTFHRTLFRIAFFVFRKLNVHGAVGRELFSAEQRASLSQSTEIVLRIMFTATRDILVLARSTKDREIEQDLSLAVSVIGQIITSPFVPSASTWLVHCQSIDLFRCAFEVFVYMEHLGDGRPLYAQHVLDLCLALAAATPRAAEQMALEGLMTALTNNALTASAEAGVLRVLSNEAGGRTAQHELWTSMLALVVALVSALGESTQFVDQEVTGFVRLYGAQLSSALSWTAETTLTLPGLEEMSTTMALIHSLVHRSDTSSRSASASASSANAVAGLFIERSLHLLQQIVYAVLHPNHLSNLIEPTTPEERAWIEKDAAAMDEGAELSKKPVVAGVTLALVQLARVIVDSLLGYSKAFGTLLSEPGDWKVERAIVTPTATVTATEKASVGTLFDLASFCQDTLRASHPAPPPAEDSKAPTSSLTPLPPYSAQLMQKNAVQVLEGVLLLSATQLALWLYSEAPATGSGDSRRATVAMHREITGELAGDLVSVLEKSVGGKAGTAKGGAGAVSSDLVSALKRFVQGRLMRDES